MITLRTNFGGCRNQTAGAPLAGSSMRPGGRGIDEKIEALWRDGFDTLDIARRLHITEAEAYSALLRVRSARR